jgi:hypothetical protein
MDAIWSSWYWPAATAVLGFIFTGLVFAQYVKRHKMHQLCWSIGLLFYSVAAVMETWSEAVGHWDPTVYRIYIVLAASLVGFLGAGSFYLISKKSLWPNIYFGFNIVMFLVFLVGTFTTTLDESKLVPGITVGGQALGASLSFPRIMSLVFNIPGTIFLLGAAVISVWRFSRKKEYAYRMWANVLIAAGTLLIAYVGSKARLGSTAGLYPAEMVASALLLGGFLMAGTLDKGAKAALAKNKARRAAQGEPDV